MTEAVMTLEVRKEGNEGELPHMQDRMPRSGNKENARPLWAMHSPKVCALHSVAHGNRLRVPED